jgi:hypothetical protein
MTFAEELSDIGRALAFARLTRGATRSGLGRIVLGGFGRGGQLAYEYVAGESQKPILVRHVKGLVPIARLRENFPRGRAISAECMRGIAL